MPRAGANGRLTVAVPSKGRMAQPALELCAAAGLSFETTDRTLMVPCENAHLAGLRRVIDPKQVERVIAVLTGEVSDMPKNWNRRFKYNREKIKTGDIFEIAEVVRNLAIREWEKGLSTGEKQMYTRAKKILASEFMYALDKDEDEAEIYLDELLANSASEKLAAVK